MKKSYIDAVAQSGKILFWERDEDGNIHHDSVPESEFTYCYMKSNGIAKTGTQSLWGDPVKRVSFDEKREMGKFADGRTDVFESDVTPLSRFIMDTYPDGETVPLNVLFYDIEVNFDLNDGHGYPTPKNPFGDINLFQCFHTGKQEYHLFIPSHLRGKIELHDETFPVRITWFDSERELLEVVADYIKDIDVMTAWFGGGFDLPYLMERALVNFDKKKALSLFCRGGVPARRRDFVNDFGEEVWSWTLFGRKHVDMMELYKKFNPSEKRSFKLDNIAEDELGIRKVDIDDSDLGELYRNNPQQFCEYGLQDARILKMLDDKLQIIRLADILAKSSFVTIGDVLGAVKPIETAIMAYTHSKGIVLPNKKDNEKTNFDGAIVYDTLNGRHGWGMSIDLAALYPSAIMMLGISPETIVMQCHGEYEDYISVMTKEDRPIRITLEEDDSVIEMSAKDLYDVIIEEGLVISASGTILNGRMGVFAEFTKNAFEKRKYYKDLMKNAESAEEKELYDLYQKVFKIFANSIYGVSGQVSFRLYDIRMSKSTTLTGQVISKYQAYKANELMKDIEGIYEEAA